MVALAWRLLDRRPWADLGLPSCQMAGRHLLLGVACGAAPAAVGFMLFLGLGWVEITPRTSASEITGDRRTVRRTGVPLWGAARGVGLSGVPATKPRHRAAALSGGRRTGHPLHPLRVPGRCGPHPESALHLLHVRARPGVFRAATGDIAAGVGLHLSFQTVAQLFDSEGAVFEVSGTATLGVFALGGLPFTVGWMAMVRLRRERLDWKTPQPSRARSVIPASPLRTPVGPDSVHWAFLRPESGLSCQKASTATILRGGHAGRTSEQSPARGADRDTQRLVELVTRPQAPGDELRHIKG
jgi:hypothetical protein